MELNSFIFNRGTFYSTITILRLRVNVLFMYYFMTNILLVKFEVFRCDNHNKRHI